MAQTADELLTQFEAKPDQLDPKDIPAVPEVELTLTVPAHGNHTNQYRGWMDEAGTVRVRAYDAMAPAKRQGTTVSVTANDITLAEPVGENIVKFEYRNTGAEGLLLVEWVPRGTKVGGLKVSF
jgi:hypothetical protein